MEKYATIGEIFPHAFRVIGAVACTRGSGPNPGKEDDVRKLACTLFTVLIGTALAASPAAAQGWALGFEGGLNVSDLSGEDVEADAEAGFRGGGVIRYEFAPDGMIGVQSGLTYSRKGASDDLLHVKLDYLEVPVVVTVNIPTHDFPVQPRVFAGGSFNFELNCDLAPSDGDAVDCDEGDALETESFDFGLRFGGGVDFEVYPDAMITLTAGYEVGLTDIASAEVSELKNRNLFFTGGFIFHP